MLDLRFFSWYWRFVHTRYDN